MNIKHFNIAVLLGWLLTSVGAMLLNLGAGLVVSGMLLLALTFSLIRIGGLHEKAGV